jgi:hypothetical protein
MQPPPPGFERPAHVPPPRLPATREPAPGAARRMARWREPLFSGFVTFLAGNALGLIAAGLLAPTDFAVATQMPDRPSVMDLWIRWGMPAVAVMAALTTYLRLRRGSEGEGLSAAVLASSLPFALAVGLVYALYPGSRAGQVEAERSNYQLINARESAASVTAASLEDTIARFRDTPYEEEVARSIQRSGLITGPQPLTAGGIAEARGLLQRGLLDDCSDCSGALRAKESWNELGPGLVGWAFDRCAGSGCENTLAALLAQAGGYGPPLLCQPLPGGKSLSLLDVQTLQEKLDARPRAIGAAEATRLEAWLARQREQCGAGQL